MLTLPLMMARIDQPLIQATGNLVVSGDVDVDLTVNGNIDVSGTISGNVVATGTITYGSLTGTIKENAVINRCDISVDGGELTVDSGIVYDNNDALYVNGSITNGSDCTTEVYCNLKVSPSSGNSLICSNDSNFTIKSGSNVNIVSSNYCINLNSSCTFALDRGSVMLLEHSGSSSSGRGIYVSSSSHINLNGSLSINDVSHGIYINNSNNSSKNIIGIYGNVTINNASSYGIYLTNGALTTNGIITINDSRIGLYLASSTYTCNGTTYISNSSSSGVSKSSASVINGTGVLYVNDDVYYDGSANGLTDFGLEMDRLSEFNVD